jgi:D-alanine transfer protein
LERRYIHELAPEFYDVKLQGVALQKQAFAQPDLLVLYGSSELAREMPNNPTQFFQDYPTGFGIFPVGKPGAASLAVLQKVASVGRMIKGKKVAFSISPGWYFTKEFDPAYYEGNFSELQASELAFSTLLSPALKQDISKRMLTYPKTLRHRDLLHFALDRLASNTFWDKCAYWAAWPLGTLRNGIERTQDHLEVALHILDEDEHLNALSASEHGKRRLIWGDLLKRAARFANATALQAKRSEVARRHLPRASRDKTFIRTLESANEWTDIELLMRVFKELGAQPLFLSMPVEDIRLEVYGISPEARDAYIERLHALADRYQTPLVDFHQYEKDPAFMVDFLDHLSWKGWLYYNKVLDDFYHGRTTSL